MAITSNLSVLLLCSILCQVTKKNMFGVPQNLLGGVHVSYVRTLEAAIFFSLDLKGVSARFSLPLLEWSDCRIHGVTNECVVQ